MSDYNCYAGPVVRCKVSYEETTTTGCTNKACSSYGRQQGGKFCNMCASPYGEVPAQYKRETVNSYKLFQPKESMFSEKVGDDRIFMPNVNRNEPRKHMFFYPSDEVQEVISSIAAETGWLCEAFAEEIGKLRAAYGTNNVTVEWLVMSWYS